MSAHQDKHPLHVIRLFNGGLIIGALRSDDGLWEMDGRILPWLWFRRGVGDLRGITIKIGGWMFAAAIGNQ